MDPHQSSILLLGIGLLYLGTSGPSQSERANTLPALPPPENALPSENNLLTQPMEIEYLMGNYTNTSFNLDSAIFPDIDSFGNLSLMMPLSLDL